MVEAPSTPETMRKAWLRSGMRRMNGSIASKAEAERVEFSHPSASARRSVSADHPGSEVLPNSYRAASVLLQGEGHARVALALRCCPCILAATAMLT